MKNIPKGKKLILFDGICNLCNSTVLKIIKYDTKNSFVFASIDSEIGKKIIHDLKIDTSKIDSIILFEPHISYHIKSSAVINIMSNLGGFWKLTLIFKIIPVKIRNIIYTFIAKNRYKWFGKKEKCVLPTNQLENKFID